MRARPPEKLVELLTSLGLASAEQVSRARRRVRRLAGKSANFDSVWIDALVQDRALTLYQAACVNRGDARELRLGPFTVLEPICQLGKLVTYRAREIATGAEYRLLTAQVAPELVTTTAARLDQMVRQAEQFPSSDFAPITHAGALGETVWGAHRAATGQTAAHWIARHGRLPPEAVFAIARQMTVALDRLESTGLVHGDVCARELSIAADGHSVLSAPGFRAAVRAREGYAEADLPPEAFDSAAPERISSGVPANVMSDRFALGVLWWQMLAGRSPWPAGDSLTRLRAIEKARLPNVRLIVPNTPEPLARAIDACTASTPERRPQSYGAVSEILSAAPMPARRKVSRSLTPATELALSWRAIGRALRPTRQTSIGVTALAACALILVLIVKAPGLNRPIANQQTASTNSNLSRSAALPPYVEVGSSPISASNSDHKHPSVAAVGFESKAQAPWESRVERAGGTPELLLPVDRPLRLATLRLVPGQVVRGAGEGRPVLIAPPEGIAVDVEDVRFSNVDFVASAEQKRAGGAGGAQSSARLVHVRAFRATFEGCTFACPSLVERGAIAIDWETSRLADRAALELPNGRVELKDCVLSDVSAGVRCRWTGALSLVIGNTLHLGPGPLVRLARAPRLDEPIGISLAHVTIREAASLLEVQSDPILSESGSIGITADECVFALRAGGSLLHLVSAQSPARLIDSVEWQGQGSVMTAHGGLANWLNVDGQRTSLDVSRLRIAGLVQSEIGFAGLSRAGPQASQAVRWQVPLRSPEPPGINEARLPKAGRQTN